MLCGHRRQHHRRHDELEQKRLGYVYGDKLLGHLRSPNHGTQLASYANLDAWSYEELRSLHERLRHAARRSTTFNERSLRRISAELHDGPAQDLGFALLRLEHLIPQAERAFVLYPTGVPVPCACAGAPPRLGASRNARIVRTSGRTRRGDVIGGP